MTRKDLLRGFALACVLATAAPAGAQDQQQSGGTPAAPGGRVMPNPDMRSAGVPSEDIMEVMIKSALMNFNDANLSGNYAVMNARLHPVFRQQAPSERLSSVFTAFRTMKINIAPILVHKPVYTEGPRLDDAGLLVAKGYFETRPWRTGFDMAWSRDNEVWWLWRINVQVKPPSD